MTAYAGILDALAACGSTVRGRGPGAAVAQCPAHDDRQPSLSVRALEDRVVLHCHAGCTVQGIVAALGLTLADLFDGSASRVRRPPTPRPVPASPWDAAMAALGLDGWPPIEHVLDRMAYEAEKVGGLHPRPDAWPDSWGDLA